MPASCGLTCFRPRANSAYGSAICIEPNTADENHLPLAENLARLLDVQQVFASDSRDPGSWGSMLLLNSDEARFLKTHDLVDRASVTQFYVLD